MSVPVPDEIVAKIQKLLAMAEHPNSNVAEASVAAAKAQALLFQYNLEVEAVRLREGAVADPYILRAYDLPETKTPVQWRRMLLSSIAQYTFCSACYFTGGDQTQIVGQQSNVEFVTYLADYLIGEVVRLARGEWMQLDTWDRRATSQVRWFNSFYLGACETLTERLRAQYLMNRKASADSQALVVVKDGEVKAAQDRLIGKVTKRQFAVSVGSDDGYTAGAQAAQAMALHRPLQGGDAGTQRLQ